ncbi:hypothetical protein J6TS1_28470 [Siminovitchia terrae]|uniref:Uncharacterized protein n=1 Tax=Siminovitchia terrae TaxID=1914933 RepID=A0ABQ4KY66_SIMTE|nr:hypothetical protein [Siminovitchia terrae]GIN96977.1 hypothetical protein J6TS1_28470 [Siminovitchia terrae]
MKNRNNIDEFPELVNFLADLGPADKASKGRNYHRLTFKMRSETIQPNFMKRNESVMIKKLGKL